jgi:hypothetical protein
MSSIFWLLSRAVHLSAFVGLYGEECMCLHVLRMWRAGRVSSYVGRYQEHIMFQDVCLSQACLSTCLHVWTARHVSAYAIAEWVSPISKLSEYLLYQSWANLPNVFALIESWASSCMCWSILRAARDLVSVGQYQGVRKYLPHLGLVSVFWPVKGAERVHDACLLFESRVCNFMYLHMSKS